MNRNERQVKIMVKYWRLAQFFWLSFPLTSFTNRLFSFKSIPSNKQFGVGLSCIISHFLIFNNNPVVPIFLMKAFLFNSLTFLFIYQHQYLF